MEQLTKKYQILLQALDTLKEAIALLDDPEYTKIYDTLRDSAIQRFEYCIDNFWKFLKIYIQEKNNILLETATPRIILREAVNSKLISENEYEELVQAITNRNLTSHSYNESVAQALIEAIPAAYNLMRKIMDTFSI